MLVGRSEPPPSGVRITISAIAIGSRHRKDMGDLAGLADSIRAEGLLQPVGITSDRKLVFGERRLRACRDILGWTEIDVRVVNVTSIAAGEHDENEIRKGFTPSERVAIATAIREEMGERRGRPEKVDDGPPFSAPGKTRDLAARQVGFSSGKQLERAGNVIRLGSPKLVEAMDSGAVSITAAADIARAAPEEQAAIVALDPGARQGELRRRREEAERIRASAHEQEERTGATAYTRFLTKNGRLPSSDEAKTIAALDFRETPSADGKRHAPGPRPSRQERARAKVVEGYQDALWRVRQALQVLAFNTEIDPALLVEHARGVDREIIGQHLKAGRAWLNRFAKEWN